MTNATYAIPHRYEVGDHATHDGHTYRVADVHYSTRIACPCRYGCPRLHLTPTSGGEPTYTHTCEVTPAEADAPEPTPAPAPTAPAPARRLAPGEHRDFPAGRVTVSVTRTGDGYRVVALNHRGLSVEPVRTFTGDSARRDAWNHIQHLQAVYAAAEETPAAVTRRVTANRHPVRATRPAAKGAQTRVTDPQRAILAAAASNPDGHINRGARATITQLYALAQKGMVELDDHDGPAEDLPGATITDLGRCAHTWNLPTTT